MSVVGKNLSLSGSTTSHHIGNIIPYRSSHSSTRILSWSFELLQPEQTHLRSVSKAAHSFVSDQVDCSIYKKYPVVAIPCPITYLPVCGSDYITYGNECHLCTETLWVLHGNQRRSEANILHYKSSSLKQSAQLSMGRTYSYTYWLIRSENWLCPVRLGRGLPFSLDCSRPITEPPVLVSQLWKSNMSSQTAFSGTRGSV